MRLQRPITAVPYAGGHGGYGGCGSLARRPLLTVPRKIADRIEAAVVGRGRRTSALLAPAPWALRAGARPGDLASLYLPTPNPNPDPNS